MNRQPPAVHVVGLIAQQICELGLQNGNDKVKGRIGVAHNEEQRRFPISNGIELHFVIRHQVAQLFDVKGCKPCAAGNQDALGGFSRDEKSRTFSSNSQTSYILLNLVAKQTLDFVLHCLSGVLVEVDTDDIGRAVYLLSDGGCGVLGGGLCCCVSVFCHSIPPVNEKCPTRKG